MLGRTLAFAAVGLDGGGSDEEAVAADAVCADGACNVNSRKTCDTLPNIVSYSAKNETISFETNLGAGSCA